MNARSLEHEGRNGTAPPPAEPIENRVLGMLAELSQSLAVSLDIEQTLSRAVRRIARCASSPSRRTGRIPRAP